MRGSVRTVPAERKSILKLVASTPDSGMVAARNRSNKMRARLRTNMLACQAMLCSELRCGGSSTHTFCAGIYVKGTCVHMLIHVLIFVSLMTQREFICTHQK